MIQNIALRQLSAFNTKQFKMQKVTRPAQLSLSLERRIIRYIKQSKTNVSNSNSSGSLFWERVSTLSENYRRRHWLRQNRTLNLSSPETLGEKLEWLKYNDHRDIFVQLCDKLSVRDYVIEKTGNDNLLNQIYGVFSQTCDIPYDDLPEKFVLKTNHWSGNSRTLVKSDLTSISWREILEQYQSQLQRKFGGIKLAEWPYWHIPPKVFFEEYLQDQFSQLVDYKFFCFNGEPKLIMVCKDRFSEHKRSYFDLDWKPMPFRDFKYPSIEDSEHFPKPDSLDEMIKYAYKMSEDLTFIRADFYDVFGECRFGELTIYPECGIGCRFEPDDWNLRIGEWLALPEPRRQPEFAFGVPDVSF